MKIAIVGAGLAGLTCAGDLRAGGHAVALFDKGRGPGGRMSSRRLATPSGEAAFDHGAQYFTARDPAFRRQTEAWERSGLVAPWPAAGPDCWVGVPAMNAPVKHLAQGADVRWQTRVDALSGGPGNWRLHGEGLDAGPFDSVLLAVPAENAAPLLQPVAPALAAHATSTPSQPCWTVMAAFASALPVAADILREDGPIGWAARNSAKPGRGGPEAWVIQAGPAWSVVQLEQEPGVIVAALLAALSERVGATLPDCLAATAHRWRYARSGRVGEPMLWDAARGLGACGDWLLGPRVEAAWLSAAALAAAVGGQPQ